jgi:hypothetical protein
MSQSVVRWSFIGFHITLGLVVLVVSVLTLAHALEVGRPHVHLGVVAGLETAGAALFLVPRTLRIGGGLLLLVFLSAVVLDAARGEFPGALLVYAAGTILVMAQGNGWAPGRRPPGTV